MDFDKLVRQQIGDQHMAAARDLAMQAATFYQVLKQNGISDHAALELTKKVLTEQFHHGREMKKWENK